MGFQRNGPLLVLPESSEHRPAEGQSQQREQLAKSLDMAEMGRFEVETPRLQGGKEGLDYPSICLRGLNEISQMQLELCMVD